MPLAFSMTFSPALLDRHAALTGIGPRVLATLIRTVAWHPRVDRAVIYGSRGRGQPKYWSDIDFAVYGPELSVADRRALDWAMEEAPVVYPVDFTHYHSRYTTDALRRAIDRDGVVIYDRASDPSLATAR